jgi:hypothetical protein
LLKPNSTWALWHVILATQEAEIRRILVQSQPLANSSKDLFLKKKSQKSVGGVVQGVDPEFKSQYCKKRKKSQ